MRRAMGCSPAIFAATPSLSLVHTAHDGLSQGMSIVTTTPLHVYGLAVRGGGAFSTVIWLSGCGQFRGWTHAASFTQTTRGQGKQRAVHPTASLHRPGFLDGDGGLCGFTDSTFSHPVVFILGGIIWDARGAHHPLLQKIPLMMMLKKMMWFGVGIAWLCVVSVGLSADILPVTQSDREAVALARIYTTLNHLTPCIEAAQRHQDKTARLQFNYPQLMRDIEAIKQGIAQKFHPPTREPRFIPPIPGDYITTSRQTS